MIANQTWKIGAKVRLASGHEILCVVGRDSVGSVICRPLNDQKHLCLYVSPSLLLWHDDELAST
jgi:hypothetical protein